MSNLGQYAKTFVKQVDTDNWFFVSTINRESSSMYGGEYSETMAWNWDNKEQSRGRLIVQDEASVDSLYNHTNIVRALQEYGAEFYLKDDDE